MKGIYSALIVPFDNNGKVMEASLRQIIRHNIEVCQVDGLYVNGSSGEAFLLSLEEKKRIFAIVKDEVKNQVKLIGQIGALNYYESIELGRYIKDLGYDAASAITPFYYKYTPQDIEHYYTQLVDAIQMPFVVYLLPQLSGVTLGLDTIDHLMQHPNIIGIKFSSTDLFLLSQLRIKYPDKLIWFGWDECLQMGALTNVDGLIGSTYNVNGAMAKALFQATQRGDIATVRQLSQANTLFIKTVVDNGVFQTLKALLQVGYQIDAGSCRFPMPAVTDHHYAIAREIMRTHFHK